MLFDLPKEQSSIIKVIGVGGGGSNAVNHMFEQGIRGVNFVICNTDAQAMELSPIPNKIQLGPSLTEGLGAGSNPEVGKLATEESIEDIQNILEKNTKMVFVTAGMGGGTGTGGAPVIAKIAKEMGILTVGIVTTPFFFEGKRKMGQAHEGINELKSNVDSIIVISNDKIREIYGNLTRSDAFARADNILSIAAKSISEIITVAGQINVDFADVEYVMKNSGVAIMGSAIAEGEDRAAKAVQGAMSSPLLNDNSIKGAQKILLNITSGSTQILIDEITEIHEYVLEEAGTDTDVIFGTCDDETLEDKISVTLIATGFEEKNDILESSDQNRRVVHWLSDQREKANVVKEPKPSEEPDNSGPSLFESSMTFDFDPPGTPAEQVDESETNIPDEPEKQEDTSQEDTAGEKTDLSDSFIQSNNDDEEKIDKDTPFIFTKKNTETPKEEDNTSTTVSNERFKYLRNLNLKMKNPNNLSELESEPAFKRKRIELSNTPHSSESNMSRYTLNDGEDDDDDQIKRNNSFLHDNVD